jgi:hypothetical protein
VQGDQKHITEVIEETIYRRVQNTIQEYVNKNQSAFAANQIAGVEWKLQINVLVDNLGLNPQPKPKTYFSRFIDFFTHLWRKAANSQELDDQKGL